jgi:predicted GTPase
MTSLIEKLIARTWNRLAASEPERPPAGNLDLGMQVVDERPTKSRVSIPQARRPEHVALLGRTGAGKSSLLRHFAMQDVRAGRGFVFLRPPRRHDAVPAPHGRGGRGAAGAPT